MLESKTQFKVSSTNRLIYTLTNTHLQGHTRTHKMPGLVNA